MPPHPSPVRPSISCRNTFSTHFMPSMGDYYQVVPGWAEARTEWWNMLQRIGTGGDVATEVETFVTNRYAERVSLLTSALLLPVATDDLAMNTPPHLLIVKVFDLHSMDLQDERRSSFYLPLCFLSAGRYRFGGGYRSMEMDVQ